MKLINLIKEVFKYKIAIVIATIMTTLLGLIGSYSWLFPLSINEKISNVEKNYLIVSIICGTLFLIFIIIISIKSGRKNKKNYYDIAYISPIIALEIICVLICINSQLWGVKNYIIGIVVFWLLFIELFVAVKSLFGKFLGQERIPIILMVFAFLSLLFAFTNDRLGENEPAKLFYQICCGVAYLLAFAVYANKYIYGLKKNKVISNILGIVLWGGLITISFPFYVQWCGLTGQNFDNFVTVYAAVLGGGITLAGVAWTINDGNKKHQEELQRIEDESKENERKRHIPYMKVVFHDEANCEVCACIYKGIDLENSDDRMQVKNKMFYQITIRDCVVKNISESSIILRGINFMGRYYKFVDYVILAKGELCKIRTTDNWAIVLAKEEKTLEIIASDILGNIYSLECKLNYLPSKNSMLGTTINEEDYKGVEYNYFITNINLPICQKRE